MKSKRYKWRIVKLSCITIIYRDESYYEYYVIQKRKRRKLFSDWHDVRWIIDDLSECQLAQIIYQMGEFIDNDNKDHNILKYSKL